MGMFSSDIMKPDATKRNLPGPGMLIRRDHALSQLSSPAGHNVGALASTNEKPSISHARNVALSAITRCANVLSVLSFGSCTSLSDWLVTLTSGFTRTLYASAAVFVAHMPTSASEKEVGALWMHLITQRRSASGVRSRPFAVTVRKLR